MARKHTKYGIPILTDTQKANALRYCLAQGAVEDAMGHLMDLFFRLKQNKVFDETTPLALFHDLYMKHKVEETKGSTVEG